MPTSYPYLYLYLYLYLYPCPEPISARTPTTAR